MLALDSCADDGWLGKRARNVALTERARQKICLEAVLGIEPREKLGTQAREAQCAQLRKNGGL